MSNFCQFVARRALALLTAIQFQQSRMPISLPRQIAPQSILPGRHMDVMRMQAIW
jgi:hypothetical protein